MQLTVETVQNIPVVKILAEQLDASNADDFKREIAPVLASNSRLVLDLGQLQFVDSSGCGAILSCLKALTSAGGDLKLCQVTRPVRNVFELIRLHRICEMFDSCDDAVRAFSQVKK
jgi:anti-sigma B factor antagonist